MGLLDCSRESSKLGVTKVCTLPLSDSGPDRAPWQPTSIARHSRPSNNLCCHRRLLVTQVWRTFPEAFATFPVRTLSASRHPERWREPHYSAFDRYRRCNSAASLVCMLPLMRSGRISAPWPPTSCARFPSRLAWGVHIFPRRLPYPDARLSPHGSQARMSLTAIFESVAVPRRLRYACNPC